MLIFNSILVAFISLWNVTFRGKSEINKLNYLFSSISPVFSSRGSLSLGLRFL